MAMTGVRAIIGEDDVRQEVGAVMRSAGIRGRHIQCGGCIGYEYTLPTQRGMLRARAWVSPPAEVGGRIWRKMKKGIKKIVKSRAFKVLSRLARAAVSVIPGGGAVTQALDLGIKAGKAIHAARKAAVRGDDSLLAALPRALQIEAAALRRARLRGAY